MGGLGATNNLRRGRADWTPGCPSPNPTGWNGQLTGKRRKIASDWLVAFYNANPKRLKKLLLRLVNEAERGKNIRYAELIIQLLEGPAKDPGTGDTYNFNFLSEGERQRAVESVERIRAMRKPVITLLPEASSDNHERAVERGDAGDVPGSDPSGS